MRLALRLSMFALLAAVFQVGPARAITIPYTENFNSNNQNWKNSVSNLSQDATWVSTGGPGGVGDSFIRSSFTTPLSGAASTAQVLFRARSTVNSSGNNFFGDWISNGVSSLDFWVRQDGTTPINIGVRIPTVAGFPAMLGRLPTPLQPNTWTHYTLGISATNPQLLDETGQTHNQFSAVFSNVTYLQLFADLSGLGTSTLINFDLDRVNMVPEPGTFALLGLGLPFLALVARVRRRRAEA